MAEPQRQASPVLSTDLEDPQAVPYFLWDEPMTVQELRGRLETASHPERVRLLAKILREARDTEVWKFTTLGTVLRLWPELSRQLGRRRRFWEFLLDEWDRQGLIERSQSPR
ncbi:MAG TPA: hypothetical protein VF789_33650 [Thermoanaerobaculia bacterium]